MRYISILAFLSLFLYAAPSKNYDISIDRKFNSNLYDVVQDNDGQITTVGYLDEATIEGTDQGNTAGGTQMHLVRIDKYADITLEKSGDLSQFNKAVSVVKTPENDYIIGGYTMDGKFVILKMDRQGKSIFFKSFGTKNFNKMNKLLPLQDGGVLAVGTSVTSRDQNDPIYETGLGLNDIFVSKIARDGTLLWSRKYGTANDDAGVDAAEAPDGSLIVLGSTSKGAAKDVILLRLNQDGDQIWFKDYKKDKLLNPYSIIKLRDNTFLASVGSIEPNGKEQENLLQLDMQGNILKEKSFPTSYSCALYDIQESANGMVVGAGYVRDLQNADTDGLIMKFTPLLELKWQEHFGSSNYDLFHKLTVLRDGDYVAVGAKTPQNSEVPNMWILKLNKDGSVSKIPGMTLHDYLYKIFKNEIDARKIFISDDLVISFSKDYLHFAPEVNRLSCSQKKFLLAFWKKLLGAMKKYEKNIQSLEINGYASGSWRGLDLRQEYNNNTTLSFQRAYNMMSFLFYREDPKTQKWLSKILKQSANNLNFNKDKGEEATREVTFKLHTKKN